MTDPTNRREFLRNLTIAGAGMAAMGADALHAAEAPATGGAPDAKPKRAGATTQPATKPAAARLPKVEKPTLIAVIGTSGRGTELATGFALLPGSIVRYVCDVDEDHAKKAAAVVVAKQNLDPMIARDLRVVLADKSVDAVAIATPDHWHAPAALLAIAAGKHVYVEKPCCHNPREGEMLVEAARKHDRLVQHGTQRRSWPKNVEAIARLKAGDFGAVRFVRGWYTNARPETGRRTPASAPATLDWELWQGPATRQPYTENVVHYKWHWFWDWGTGELGNNGVHALDVCRWGLGVDYARKVTAAGGRYYFQDDQQTPDTLSVTYDFGDKTIVWEGRSCNANAIEGSGFGAAFYGDKSTLIIDGGGYRVLNPKGKEVENVTGSGGNEVHLQNFLDAIAGKAKLNAEIEEGYKSALLCHLGNMAWRTGRTLACDPKTGRVTGDRDAEALWGRAYEPGWEPKA